MKKYSDITVGVLDLQGDVIEHVSALERCGAKVLRVKTFDELKMVDGLILPGGESTTMRKLLDINALTDTLKSLKIPIYGTCAGTILLAHLGLMDIDVERNAYGRQLDSFETIIDVTLKGRKTTCHGVFIRAPKIKSVGQKVEVLAQFESTIVMVRQGRLIATTFHPELTDDLTIHQYFLDLIHESKRD